MAKRESKGCKQLMGEGHSEQLKNEACVRKKIVVCRYYNRSGSEESVEEQERVRQNIATQLAKTRKRPPKRHFPNGGGEGAVEKDRRSRN